MSRMIKLQVVKGPEGYSLQTFDNRSSGKRVAGPKPWGGGEVVHTFECEIERLIHAIRANGYGKEASQ